MIQIESIAPLFDRYQGLIVDLWGVMHNGERLFAPAVAALAAARARGLGIVLLSNAPRRAATAQSTSSIAATKNPVNHFTAAPCR